MENKRVLQIACHMYPHIGGIEQTVNDICKVLSKENYSQKVICFNEDASDGIITNHRKYTSYDLINNVNIIRCSCFTKVASQCLSFSFCKELCKVMNNFEPDIVIFHYPNPFMAFFFLPYLKRNFKLILYWHLDITKQKIIGKLFHPQTMKLLKRADVIVATSPNYIEGSPYLKQFRNKCIIIPGCVSDNKRMIDTNSKERAQQIRKFYEGKTICFALGRHVLYKGFDYLIEASKYLNDSYIILIGGEGPLSEKLKKKAKNNTKIKFLCMISNEDLLAYFSACDIFCFPSITKNEAFGLSLAEAMIFEKPTITFEIPGSGVNYVSLNKITGIECPNRDSKAFAEAIMILASDENLCKQYGKAAQKRALDYFTFEKFEENIHKLFKKIQ